MDTIDDEWIQWLKGESEESDNDNEITLNDDIKMVAPECGELNISTKTKVLYLNTPIDIETIFWKLPILQYWIPNEGVIKKQMKIVSKTSEDVIKMKERLEHEYYYVENILKQIDNIEGRRIKFKDERKITIGMSKKDILNSRCKVKNAFYNCFAMIIRYLYLGSFREIHVKVFNTGKLEIPGVINDDILFIVKKWIIDILNPLMNMNLEFLEKEKETNVLINSNFNCGFYINRDVLYKILKNEYNIETSYEPCSYPGVKCKFYFNNLSSESQNGTILDEDRDLKVSDLIKSEKYTEISFMVFRTGSCLIIGNCNEIILRHVYDFISNILQNIHSKIVIPTETQLVKEKVKKAKKKVILVSP
jgi:hypothetical protein